MRCRGAIQMMVKRCGSCRSEVVVLLIPFSGLHLLDAVQNPLTTVLAAVPFHLSAQESPSRARTEDWLHLASYMTHIIWRRMVSESRVFVVRINDGCWRDLRRSLNDRITRTSNECSCAGPPDSLSIRVVRSGIQLFGNELTAALPFSGGVALVDSLCCLRLCLDIIILMLSRRAPWSGFDEIVPASPILSIAHQRRKVGSQQRRAE